MMDKIALFEHYHTVFTFTVSEEIYTSFQKYSGDFNPLHTDDEFSKSNGFKKRIMYGNILNVFVSYTVGMRLPSPDVMLIKQDILFRQAVYLNDVLKLEIWTDHIHESVSVVVLKYKFRNKDHAIVASGCVQVRIL